MFHLKTEIINILETCDKKILTHEIIYKNF